MSEVRTYAMHVLLDRPWHVKIDYLSYLEMRRDFLRGRGGERRGGGDEDGERVVPPRKVEKVPTFLR